MFRIAGSFCVATPSDASQYRERVLTKLTALLEGEEAGRITVSGSTIKYRRGYPMSRYSKNRLKIFDPGELSVIPQNAELTVRYQFGLEHLYLPVSAVAIILALLLVESPNKPVVLLFVAWMLFVFCGGAAYSLYRVRRWLQEAVVDVVGLKENQA